MGQKLKIEYDMEEMFLGMKDAIKEELKPEIANEIRAEIKEEVKKEILEKVKEKIPDETEVWLKQLMTDIYENEKISVGGGWDRDAKEYTLREYVIEQIKERIINNNCVSKKSYSRETFHEWFTNQCVDSDIKRVIEKEIKSIRDDVNLKVKNMFDSSTKEMLSQTVLNLLMANDTYKKIEANIGSIASK